MTGIYLIPAIRDNGAPLRLRKGGRRLAAAGIIKVIAGSARRPIIKDLHQSAIRNLIIHHIFRQVGKADASQRHAERGADRIEGSLSLRRPFHLSAVFLQMAMTKDHPRSASGA